MSIETRAGIYGKIFTNWEIGKRIGHGGQAEVFELKRKQYGLTEECAVKIVNLIEVQKPLADLKGYEAERDKRTEREIQEVALMQSLRGNPNIVECYDYEVRDWEENDSLGRDLLIRMELLCKLQEHLKSNTTYNDAEVIQIGKDICKALIACHERNILHRDIKTGNILWNENSRNYKLGDFGISRYVESGALASTIGIGTYSYMAPEQILGLGKGYDHRSDIYSLGLVLYLLSNENRMPFAQTIFVTMAEVKQRLAGNPLPNPCKASKELCNIILKACAYKPDQRYQSAQEFYDTLCAVSTKKTFDDENVHATVLLRGGINYKRETVPLNAFAQQTKAAAPESKSSSNIENSSESQKIKFLRRKAEQGDADAQYNFGNCYYLGRGVKQDYAEAAKWYRRAAEQNHADAQYNLGDCYYFGDGVTLNYEEAAKWYHRYEEQTKDSNTQYRLGACYYDMQDYTEAVKWYRKSAEQDWGWGQYKFGRCYEEGKGVKQDYAEAEKWYKKAMKNGSEYLKGEVEKALERLNKGKALWTWRSSEKQENRG